MKETLKKLMNELKEAREKANKADDAWDKNPEDEALEAAFDEAYKAEYEAFNRMAEALVTFTNGKMDFKTSRAVLRQKFDEVANLIERLA